MSDVLNAALEYAQHGWAIFPVKGKKPALVSRWSMESSTDPEVIERWFAGRADLGIGVDLRKSKLAVVDGDNLDQIPDELMRLLETSNAWEHRGNPQRKSWMFSENGHPIKQAVHGWGEVKAAGGYIVLAPSPHAVGGRYTWLSRSGDTPPVMPEDIETLVAPVVKDAPDGEPWEGDPVTDEELVEAVTILKRMSDRLAATRDNRNIALNTTALILGHYVPHYLSEKAVRDALEDACDKNGLTYEDGLNTVRATIKSGMTKGMSEPQKIELLMDEAAIISELMLPDEFWCTDELRTVRQAAHAAQLGAAGLLGAVLARMSMLTHHSIELPRVRNRGTLNLLVGLVMESGAGKGASVEVATYLLPSKPTPCQCGEHSPGDFIVIPPGSGEGLTRAFWESVRDGNRRELRRDRSQVLIDVDEIETLLAITGRSGSTIGPVLRSMWSGANAGFQNASADRRFPLEAGTYRVAMVAGVQPSVVAKLFDETMGGTPQRFLWMPAHAHDIPNLDAGETLPDRPEPLKIPAWDAEEAEIFEKSSEIAVASEVRQEVELRRNRVARGVEVRDPLDSHRDFLRLRVAALLARLHDEWEVTVRWWELAGMVLDLSDKTREGMLKATRSQSEERDRMAGIRAARRQAAADEAIDQQAAKSAASMWRVVKRHGEEGKHETCSRRCLTQAASGRGGTEGRAAAVSYALDHDLLVEKDGRFTLGALSPRGE